MYGIFTNIYPINEPNVGKYIIHGASGFLFTDEPSILTSVYKGFSSQPCLIPRGYMAKSLQATIPLLAGKDQMGL